MAGFLDQVFGSVPTAAPFIPTDPMMELSTLLSGEIKDWSQITNISDLYQKYMLSALDEAIPGFTDILKQGGTDTSALLKSALPLEEGKIPPDVAAAVARSAAFQSLGAGTVGGPMGAALAARDFGLTSLDLMNQGANLLGQGTNAAQRWSQIAGGTILPPSQSMYSPEFFLNFMQQQNQMRQAQDQLQRNLAAAPDPALQALNQWVEQVGGTVVGSYLGGGMGGGGGKNYMTSWNPNQYGTGAQASVAGGQNLPGGMNVGGFNPFAATTGGVNFGATNFGGTNIPYLGGNVSTPSGPGYGGVNVNVAAPTAAADPFSPQAGFPYTGPDMSQQYFGGYG